VKRDPSYAQHIAFTGTVQALLHLLTLNYAKAQYRFDRGGREADLDSERYAAALVWQQANAIEAAAGCAGLRERLISASRDQAALFNFWLHGNEQDVAAMSAIYCEHMRWLSVALELVSPEPARIDRRLDMFVEAACS
jgi:hypothetical protein